jgi:hypothetical protein
MAQEIEITFRVLPEQAATLLKFLRRVGFDAVAEALDDDGEKIRALCAPCNAPTGSLIDCTTCGGQDQGRMGFSSKAEAHALGHVSAAALSPSPDLGTDHLNSA